MSVQSDSSPVVEQAVQDLGDNAGPVVGNDLESFLDLAASALNEESPAPEKEGEEEAEESEAQEADGSEDQVESDEEADELEESDEDAEEPEEEADEEDDEEAEAPSRSQKRIRQLANQRKQAEARAAQIEKQFSDFAAQAQAQNQHLAGYVQHLAGQLQALQRAPQAPKEYDSPFAELLDKTRGALTPEVQSIIQQSQAPLLQELQQMRAERDAERQAKQQAAADAEWKSGQQKQLDVAIKKVFGKAPVSKSTRLAAEQMLLGISLANNGADILEILPEARELLNDLKGSAVSAKRAAGKEIKSKNAGVPKAPRVSLKARGDSVPRYSKEQLLDAGYPTIGAAMRDKFSRLRKVKPAGR